VIKVPKARQATFDDLQRNNPLLTQAIVLVSRLERISADSVWAHRSSGIRGELLKHVEAAGRNPKNVYQEHLGALILSGYKLLEQSARDMIE
jgi:hypothetical protein